MNSRITSIVAVCAGFVFAAHGSVHDRDSLLAQLAESRAPLSSAEVRFTVWRAEPELIPFQSFVAAWGPEGFRVDSVTDHVDPDGWVDEATLAFDSATGAGIHFIGGRHATISSEPQFAADRSIADYFALMGWFPMFELAIGHPLPNDASAFIAHPDSTINDGFTTVAGHECIIVERWLAGPAAGFGPRVIGAYAPSLGLAQVEMSVIGADGCVSSWRADQFMTVEGTSVHLPTSGTFIQAAADGTIDFQRTISIEVDAGGAPLVVLGAAPQVNVDLPVGTTVVDLDSGASWVIAADAVPSDSGAGGSLTEPVGRFAIAAVGLLALTCFGAVLRRRRPAR